MKKDRRTRRLDVRCTSAQRVAYEKAAAAAGMKLSAWVLKQLDAAARV